MRTYTAAKIGIDRPHGGERIAHRPLEVARLRRDGSQACSSEVMMGINLVVAVTDDDWFEMLRRHPNLSEVNFWAPSAATFRALQSGEMFLFKLHAPRNMIAGGGIFTAR